VAYVRTVKTASGATAVQIVHGSRRGARQIEHLGSAHDEQELEALKAAARQRLAGGQGQLELGLDTALESALAAVGPGPLQIASSQMSDLWQGLGTAYDVLGLDAAAGVERHGQGTHPRVERQQVDQPALQQGDAVAARDQGQGQEVLRDDLHSRLAAQHPHLI
jgi:hypothetical protein